MRGNFFWAVDPFRATINITMLYIIALLLLFILLAVVWGKSGFIIGLTVFFILLVYIVLLVVSWIYGISLWAPTAGIIAGIIVFIIMRIDWDKVW